ncbi:hypothetical protein EGW08_013122 [Elysia chlorotica]|uniref:Uncharacterized protein n=1 Tax=Elysia chlorotica TaxID=188477 RepID=A0A3S1B9N3_ELYCH|nr:hypothetical protein EGW08_013122 [Elysia chlorotica]
MSSPSYKALLDKSESATASASPDDSLNNSRTEEQLLDISDNSINDDSESKEAGPDGWQDSIHRIEEHDAGDSGPGVVDPQHVTVQVGKALQSEDSPAATSTTSNFIQNNEVTPADSSVKRNDDPALIDVEHTAQDRLRNSGVSSSNNVENQTENSNQNTDKSNSPAESNPNSLCISPSSPAPSQTSECAIPTTGKPLSGSNNNSNNNDSKKKKPLQVSASLCYETEEKHPGASSPSTRVRREDRRSNSVDVPSIHIRSEDYNSSDEDRNSSSGKNRISDNNNTIQEQDAVHPESTDALLNDSSKVNHVNGQSGEISQSLITPEDKRSANIKPIDAESDAPEVSLQTEPSENAATLRSGGPGPAKLAASYSLDVPEPNNLSLSLNRLEPYKRRRSQGEGTLVEDKLITSSSMTRLPDGRRKSWCSEVSPRSSKGSIFEGEWLL